MVLLKSKIEFATTGISAPSSNTVPLLQRNRQRNRPPTHQVGPENQW